MAGSKKNLNKKSAREIKLNSPEELRKMIAETAYCLAEQRGFEGGCQLHDWLEAEARIHRIHGKAV
ncbi:Protein of unknown function (DUF2934) [Mariprofundus aestuarium]|uniref:DUF2934 domain-containing protein n=1 Tax=Mariprofundus aestuarium TaxID=1921086 RepID=A0A2K8KVC4_MARES|nr:DUF2934 domain-containing protein [Mariprofundus aestuarium]ATX78750.1 Protein of unknown function (DUF2934) [Mariprofundus aestuarium]